MSRDVCEISPPPLLGHRHSSGISYGNAAFLHRACQGPTHCALLFSSLLFSSLLFSSLLFSSLLFSSLLCSSLLSSPLLSSLLLFSCVPFSSPPLSCHQSSVPLCPCV